MCEHVRPKVRALRRLIRKCHFLSQSNWGRHDAPILSMLRGQGRHWLVILGGPWHASHFRSCPNSRHSIAVQYMSQWATNGNWEARLLVQTNGGQFCNFARQSRSIARTNAQNLCHLQCRARPWRSLPEEGSFSKRRWAPLRYTSAGPRCLLTFSGGLKATNRMPRPWICGDPKARFNYCRQCNHAGRLRVRSSTLNL